LDFRTADKARFREFAALSCAWLIRATMVRGNPARFSLVTAMRIKVYLSYKAHSPFFECLGDLENGNLP